MKASSEKDLSHKRPYRVSRSKRHPKAKSIDSVIFEAKKYVTRVAKVVKVYLVRKSIRNSSLNEDEKKDHLVKLKEISCVDIGETVISENCIPLITSQPRPSNLVTLDPNDEIVKSFLSHAKIKEAADIWSKKIMIAEAETVAKLNAARPVKSAGSVLNSRETGYHVKKSGITQAFFVESLVDNEDEAEVTKEKEEKRRRRQLLASKKKNLLELSKYMPVGERPDVKSNNRDNRHVIVRDISEKQRPRDSNFRHPVDKIVALNPVVSDDVLHPSWAAKKKEKMKISYTGTISEGKKIVFED